MLSQIKHALLFLFFVNRDRHIFPQNARVRKDKD